MSLFERYLAIRVGLCVVAGVTHGHFLPGVSRSIGAAEYPNVIMPMPPGIDFAGARQGRRLSARDRGIDRGAGHALRRLDREQLEGLVRARRARVRLHAKDRPMTVAIFPNPARSLPREKGTPYAALGLEDGGEITGRAGGAGA